MESDPIQKAIEELREAYRKAYEGILSDELLAEHITWFEDFLAKHIQSAYRQGQSDMIMRWLGMINELGVARQQRARVEELILELDKSRHVGEGDNI